MNQLGFLRYSKSVKNKQTPNQIPVSNQTSVLIIVRLFCVPCGRILFEIHSGFCAAIVYLSMFRHKYGVNIGI